MAGWGNTKPPLGVVLDPGHPLAEKLEGFWLFGAGAGTVAYDSSKNVGALTLQSALWTSGSSGTGRALSLDGTNYASVTCPAAIDGFTRFSVAMRLYTDNISGGPLGFGSIGANSTDGSPLYLLQRNAATLRVLLGNVAYANLTTAMEVDRWYTVVSTWDGANERHWLDGAKVADLARSMSTIHTTTLFFGTGFNGAATGGVEFGAVWSRALTEAEAVDLTVRPYDLFQTRRRKRGSAQAVISTTGPPEATILRQSVARAAYY